MYEMKEEYLTGIGMIDEEHKKLFEIAEKTYQLLHEEFIPDKYDHIREILQELKDYTAKHFSDEEAYMESIHYKRMFSQKTQHEAFCEKLDEYDLTNLEEGQEEAIGDILTFLTDWLVNHILYCDKLIGKD